MIGVVKNSEIKKNRDSDSKVILLQVEITDPDDVQTIELMSNAGVNNNPVDGSIVFIGQAGSAFKIAIAADDGIEPDAEKGEYEIYSSESGTKKASARCKVNGHLVLNFGDDFAVRFSKLKDAFDELKNDVNTFITTIHNPHTHPDPVSGNTGTPSVTGSSSTADIDPAKIDDILVPGVTP